VPATAPPWSDWTGAARPAPVGERFTAGRSFSSADEAGRWLASVETAIYTGEWRPPGAQARPEAPAFKEWAETLLARKRPLDRAGDPMARQPKGRVAPRTWAEYRRVLDKRLLPEFGETPLDQVTPAQVGQWFAEFEAEPGARRGGDVARARAYALLSIIFNEAIRDGLLDRSPCQVRGGSLVDNPERPPLPTEAELLIITESMPARLRLALQLGSRTGMRVGEVLGLRRGDFNLTPDAESVSVARQADNKGKMVPLKTKRSARSIPITPVLADLVRAHLAEHCGPEEDAPLFPAKDNSRAIPRNSFNYHWANARAAAGWKPGDGRDLNFVSRHYGLTRVADAGGLSDIQTMRMGGQVTTTAHARYREPDLDAQRAALLKVERGDSYGSPGAEAKK
jgi:integrase